MMKISSRHRRRAMDPVVQSGMDLMNSSVILHPINQILAFCRTQFYFSDSIHMILRSPCHFSQDLLMSRYRTVFSFQCHPQSFLLQDVIHSPVCDQPSIIFFYRIDHLFLEQFHRLIPAVCSCDGKYHI